MVGPKRTCMAVPEKELTETIQVDEIRARSETCIVFRSTVPGGTEAAYASTRCLLPEQVRL